MTREERITKAENALKVALSHQEDMRLSLKLAEAQVACLQHEVKLLLSEEVDRQGRAL